MYLLGYVLLSLCITAYTNSGHAAPSSEKKRATEHIEKIVLGSGCFWGAEKRYQQIDGVINAVSGYADGQGVSPTYRAITKRSNKHNPNNHAEVVEVTYNSNRVSAKTLLMHFFEHHDPTQLNRQGNDIGTQYRSIILTTTEQQLKTAEELKTQFQPLLTQQGFGEIATIIKPLDTFYKAENYHQDYLAKNPNGYCPDLRTGVTFTQAKTVADKTDNTPLFQGKHIVVIESQGYCPYCEKFKKDVLNDYQGSIPVTTRLASQLDGLTISTPTWATPTILFIEDGKEVFGRQGYLNPEEFYLMLGQFKLGQSEAFNVAFDEGTDGRFCKEYEIFKNTPDGVFIDKLSGAPLFDTRHRFNSGTGWLSFTRALPDSVIEKADNRYGMRRTEIRSKTSGIHLGHVFDDGPNGQRRFCINATVLEFIPRT